MPKLDFKKVQKAQPQALRGKNKQSKYDESKAVRQKISVRLHRDTIEILEAATSDEKSFTDVLKECLAIGMRVKRLKYVD